MKVGPEFNAAAGGASGTVMCTTFDGTLSSMLGLVAPVVNTLNLDVIETIVLQSVLEVISLSLVSYVYFTNRRIRAQWALLRRVSRTIDQTMPIRVSLRRNVDIAGALIASGIAHAASCFCTNVVVAVIVITYYPTVPPVLNVRYSRPWR